ncbi:MAG: peptidyl-prolyl cis-trans isomerase, partial [Rubrimonas sp.]
MTETERPAAPPSAARPRAAPPRRRGLLARIADEPLAQFLAIGLLIFAVDRLTATEAADPRRIVLDQAAYGDIVSEFAIVEGRAPSPAEMDRLAEQWVMNETLYREARALRLDEGDEMVRERIMQKLRVLMHSAVVVDDPDDETLRAWFEENRARYDSPERLSFRLGRLDGTEDEARALAARLNAVFAGEARLAPGEVNVFPFPDRPRPVLEQVFGPDMVAAVAALPEGVWAPLDTVNGWQAALFEGATPGEAADFEAMRLAVAAEWREAAMRRAARQSVEALMAGYRVERAP